MRTTNVQGGMLPSGKSDKISAHLSVTATGVLVAVGADVLVAVGGAGVDEGLGATVGVAITAGPQAMRVKSRNRDASFFMIPPITTNSLP